MLSLCGAPPQGLCKAAHHSGVYWKQFMVLLEEVLVCGGVSFQPPYTSRPGRRMHPCDGSAQCQGCQCTTAYSLVVPVTKFEGGLSHELAPPGGSCARGAHSVKAAGRLKWARWRSSDRP